LQQLLKDIYIEKNTFMIDAFDRFAAKLSNFKNNNGCNLFTISGCEPGVGTTTVAINTSIALAMGKRRVLLVDSDMRKHSINKRLNQNILLGLSDYLMDMADYNNTALSTNIEYLDYMPCGGMLENPVMLLSSYTFDDFILFIKKHYEYVVFDSPTLNATVDAGILASKTDGIILVAGYKRTRTDQIRAAKKELGQLNANIIGVLFNNIPKSKYKRYVKYYNHYKNGHEKE